MSERSVGVRLAGGYAIEQIDRLIRDLQPLLALESPARLKVDLTGLVHLCPAALALLTASLASRQTLGLVGEGSSVVNPASKNVANYLLRMDVPRILGLEPPEDFERRTPSGFRPCQRFVGEEYHDVAVQMTEALVEACSTDEVARFSIQVCLDEIAENVLHHADAPSGGFAVAQAYPKKGKFEVGIVDLGIGVPASLRKNPRYAHLDDDVLATTTALEAGVSSTPERNAGIGLFVTKLLLRANGGMLLVRTGRAAVVSGAKEAAGPAENLFRGTIVTLRVRTDQPLNINEVYKALENADDGSPRDPTL